MRKSDFSVKTDEIPGFRRDTEDVVDVMGGFMRSFSDLALNRSLRSKITI